MRHVTCECVMSRMDKSCHVWIRHVMYECDMSRMNASCHVNASYHDWMRQITCDLCLTDLRLTDLCLTDLCLTDLCLTNHKWFVRHKSASYHVWMRHITCDLCLTCTSHESLWLCLTSNHKSYVIICVKSHMIMSHLYEPWIIEPWIIEPWLVTFHLTSQVIWRRMWLDVTCHIHISLKLFGLSQRAHPPHFKSPSP